MGKELLCLYYWLLLLFVSLEFCKLGGGLPSFGGPFLLNPPGGIGGLQPGFGFVADGGGQLFFSTVELEFVVSAAKTIFGIKKDVIRQVGIRRGCYMIKIFNKYHN